MKIERVLTELHLLERQIVLAGFIRISNETEVPGVFGYILHLGSHPLHYSLQSHLSISIYPQGVSHLGSAQHEDSICTILLKWTPKNVAYWLAPRSYPTIPRWIVAGRQITRSDSQRLAQWCIYEQANVFITFIINSTGRLVFLGSPDSIQCYHSSKLHCEDNHKYVYFPSPGMERADNASCLVALTRMYPRTLNCWKSCYPSLSKPIL